MEDFYFKKYQLNSITRFTHPRLNFLVINRFDVDSKPDLMHTKKLTLYCEWIPDVGGSKEQFPFYITGKYLVFI